MAPAAKSGTPQMTGFRPTIPLSVPPSAQGIAAPAGEVIAVQPEANVIDKNPDARANPPGGQAANPAGGQTATPAGGQAATPAGSEAAAPAPATTTAAPASQSNKNTKGKKPPKPPKKKKNQPVDPSKP